ncbi:unnamed protein product [Euphydryas editha]|uniref:Odorant receptor n=1 Tax=Euphydryas editha TaxID=104508 RepID=A0AAU9VA88_EUPED|nr:unnamed protein product [Euphydryas editha]
MHRIFAFFQKILRPYHGSVKFKNIISQSIREIGLWYGPKTYEIYGLAKLSILCFLGTNLTQIIALIMARDDTKRIFAYFSVLSFCTMGFLKLWSLFRKEKRWRSIINQASSLENEQLNNSYTPYEYESDEESDYGFSKYIDSYTKNFFLISTRLFQIYIFTAIVYMVSPFLEHGIYLYTGQPINSIPHILPGWYPLDRYTFAYIVTIFVEMLAALYCVKVHIAFDLTVIGLMIFIRGQFSCLHDYSELIGGKGKSCDISKRRDERALYRIKNCHRIHVLLIKTNHELNELIRNILGIYFFVATFTLCSVAMQLSWEQVSVMQLTSLLQYMGATLTQLFLFCHYGNAVLNESCVGQGRGPSCATIWCLSVKVRREIAILCVGMSRCYRLNAGPFNLLNLPSFIQIIRTAYSYYALLRQTTK